MVKRNLLLISGIPGVGKTTIGNFLERNYGYKHIDMEKHHRTSRIIREPEKFFTRYFSGNRNIVITWGFSPDKETIDIVNDLLKKHGFEVFWFYGNEDLARKATLKRKGFDEAILQKQMNALKQWNVPDKIQAQMIDVFDKKGNFKEINEIAKEIGAIKI